MHRINYSVKVYMGIQLSEIIVTGTLIWQAAIAASKRLIDIMTSFKADYCIA